jgi:hypothetical protein
MILQERDHALKNTPLTAEETALDSLSGEEVKELCQTAVAVEERQARVPDIQMNADVFMAASPEIIDSERNGKLIAKQLEADGVDPINATPAHYKAATDKLKSSGLLTLNQKVIAAQHRAEVQQKANAWTADFDGPIHNSSGHEPVSAEEDALYAMSMSDLTKKARGF